MAKLESKIIQLNSGQDLPDVPESKQEPEVQIITGTSLTEDAFSTFSVPSDGSCLFWAVTMAYLLPVKNNGTCFSSRFQELFGEREETEVTYARELVANYNFETINDDQQLKELVSHAFRNRVVDEMKEQEAEVHQSVTLEDFLRMKNDAFITNGAFRERFLTQFPSESQLIDLNRLKPNRLDEKSIDLMNGELDKISDKEKVQKFKFRTYLESMRNRKCWAGPLEIGAIQKLLQCQISVFSKENTKFRINRSIINIFLFKTDEFDYVFGLVKTEVVVEALKNKKYQLAVDLISLGVDNVDFQDENGDSALHFAVLSDNQNDLINKLVFQGADLNLRNNLSKSPSDLANDLNLKRSIRILDNYAKQIKEKSSIDHNKHKISVVVMLPGDNANLITREPFNAKLALEHQKSAVEAAASVFYDENVSVVLPGDNANSFTREPVNAKLALEHHQSAIEAAASVFYDKNGLNALHLAAVEGNEGIVRLLLSTSGQHPLLTHDLLEAPTRNDRRQRALHLAVLNDRSKVVECLIERGAEVNVKDFSVTIEGKDFENADHSNWTPLHYAAERGNLKIVRTLVEIGKAEVDVKDYSGGSPLQRAVKFGHLEVVKYLLLRGAEVTSKDKTKVCVLSYAARAGRDDVIDQLIANGADIDSLDQHGMSPAQHAANCQKWNALKRLVERGVNVNMEDNNKKTLLARVVKAGKWDVVRFLLENGALLIGLSEQIKRQIFTNVLKIDVEYRFSSEIEKDYAEVLESIRSNEKGKIKKSK